MAKDNHVSIYRFIIHASIIYILYIIYIYYYIIYILYIDSILFYIDNINYFPIDGLFDNRNYWLRYVDPVSLVK